VARFELLGVSSVPPRKVLVVNAGFDRHFPEQTWEEYALGMSSEEACALLEEHLLVCSACQDLLAEVDEYIRIARAAAALLERTAKRLSKPMASSTLA